MKNYLARMASLLLAFGLLFGCSSTLPDLYQARMNMDEAQYEEALESINREIDENPSNPEAYYLKGNILFELALNHQNPSDRTPLYEDMREALVQSRDLYRDSSSAIRSVELNNINNLLNNGWTKEYRSGLTYIESDTLTNDITFPEALAHFDNAITLVPDSIQAYRHKARIQYRQGNHNAAINTLRSILEQYERPAPATLEQLAYLYQKTGAFDQAVSLYEEAFRQSEDNTNLVHGLINAYIERGSHQSAVRLLDTLVSRYPGNASYRLTYGGELYQLASAELDTIKSYAGDTPAPTSKSDSRKQAISTHWQRADTLLQKARRQYAKADSMNPNSPDIDYSAALFYKNLALDYRAVVPILPNDYTSNAKSTVEEHLKMAIHHLEEAVAQNPENPQFWSQLYQLYSHFGMKEKANKARNKANL